jgi:predicted anti-sigma-YlaC factor YlaD
MQEHLTDEQLAEQLAGHADARAHEHLAVCPACRDEQERMDNLLARCREAIRAAASRSEAFWQWQRTAVARRRTERSGSRRLAWAAATAALVLIAILLTEKRPPAKPLAQSDPDQALLVDVERSVRREVPRALEPAALLAQEISRGAEAGYRETRRKTGQGEWE